MASPASALLDSAATSRKRRFSALELLSLHPTPPQHPKRPRILILDDDGPSQASPELPPGSGKAIEAIASSGESDASSASESTSTSGASESETDSGAADDDPPRSSDIDIDEDAAASNDGSSTSSSSSSSSSFEKEEDDATSHIATPTPSTSFGRTSSRHHERRLLRSASSSRSRSSDAGVETLQTRLQHFLPQLRAANAELDVARQAGTLRKRAMEIKEDGGGEAAEDADDESTGTAGTGTGNGTEEERPPYIEMNLGLGVLEQKKPKREGSAASSSSSSSASSEGDEAEGPAAEQKAEANEKTCAANKPPRQREKQVLRKLMGQRKPARPDIHVVEEREEA